LIGRQWVTLADEEGPRRLDDPDDFVRFEIQTALERRVRVIPVLVDGARAPRPQELPAGLQELEGLNTLELSYGRYEYDAGRLLDLIQRVLAAVDDLAAARADLPSLEPTDTELPSQESVAETLLTPPPGSRATGAQGAYGGGRTLEAADRIAQEVSSVTELIAQTLGPMGRKCVLQDQAGHGIEASDARTIAEHFVPEDPRDALGVTYIREMIRDQQDAAHDGTATATVLAHAMTTRACPVDHGTGSRSQIRIDARSTVPWYMASRLS
jgi:TCP-1/cpn60 chaperonin family